MQRLPILRAGALIAVLALTSPAQASVVLNVNGSGILTGAHNVDVNGTLYDVTFADGTCASLFGGCTDASNFAFTTDADARAAAAALENQVLLNTVSGEFDSNRAYVRLLVHFVRIVRSFCCLRRFCRVRLARQFFDGLIGQCCRTSA